jgi:hypothetical protein
MVEISEHELQNLKGWPETKALLIQRGINPDYGWTTRYDPLKRVYVIEQEPERPITFVDTPLLHESDAHGG